MKYSRSEGQNHQFQIWAGDASTVCYSPVRSEGREEGGGIWGGGGGVWAGDGSTVCYSPVRSEGREEGGGGYRGGGGLIGGWEYCVLLTCS